MNNKSSYWISTALKNALLLIIMCIVYGAFMYIGKDGKSITDIINETIMFYYMIVSIAIIAVFCNTTIPLMLDTVLSLGSTRKDAFKHINLFVAVTVISLTAVFITLGLVSGKSMVTMLPAIITYVSCLMFSAGMGSIGGAHNLKKGARLLFIYFCSILFAVLASLAVLMFSGTINIMTDGDFSINLAKYGKYVILASIAFAIIFYPLGMLKMKKQLYIHEVRI